MTISINSGTDSIPYVNSIFQQPWWLEAVAPGRWREIVLRREGEVVARLPYVMKKKYGLKLITMPKLTQTLGPWLKISEGRYFKQISRRQEWLIDLINELPPHDYFLQYFHYSITDWLPFYWKGFTQTTYYTYIIEDLNNLDRNFFNFEHSKKKNIKKAEKLVIVCEDLSSDAFYANHVLTLKKQGKVISYSYDLFRRIYEASYAHNSGKTWFAKDNKGNIHAAIFVIFDQNSAYYLVSSIDPEFRNSGASTLLLRDAIKYVSQFTNRFDFEGSMIKEVANSFRKFGSIQKHYFQIAQMNRRMKMLMSCKDLWKAIYNIS